MTLIKVHTYFGALYKKPQRAINQTESSMERFLLQSPGVVAVVVIRMHEARTQKSTHINITNQQIRSSAANRLIGEVVQSRRRPLRGPSPC